MTLDWLLRKAATSNLPVAAAVLPCPLPLPIARSAACILYTAGQAPRRDTSFFLSEVASYERHRKNRRRLGRLNLRQSGGS